MLFVPVSAGELIDKITILEIKEARIEDAAKRANVRRELAALREVARDLPEDETTRALRRDLREINEALWEIEDDIRAHEARADFGDGFVQLARAVYRTNDRRAVVKRELNLRLGSDLVEEKSYVDPDGDGRS